MTTDKELLDDGWRHAFDSLENEILIPPEVPLEFIPHPSAPLFTGSAEDSLIVTQLIDELTSENAQLTPEVIELTRQASLVNLWFFLTTIAGFAGPYNDLTDHIHRDMCNFRQRSMKPGSRFAIFIPRSFYKSTITTHGANAWELLRDPNIRIGMVASKMDMAQQFLWATQRIFDDNALLQDIFPDSCPAKGVHGNILQSRWNRLEMVMPNRTRNMPEASIKCLGAGSATAGNHFDLLNTDDLVGEKQLNAMHSSGDEMLKIGNWFSSNQDTLLVSPKTSRVFLAATRYAPDDAYEQIYTDCSTREGFWEELPYEENPKGMWTIYHRQAIERDRLTFPEKVDRAFLDRIRISDPWKYFTQYINNPFSAQASEFADYTIARCDLDYNNGDYTIIVQTGGITKTIPLRECTVTMGVDPAASDTRRSARTSRSAIVVQAVDALNRHYYIDVSIGYYAPTKFFDEIFRLWEKFKYYIALVGLEGQGGFKFVYNRLIEEITERKKGMPLKLIRPLPDKDAKLRIFFQPLLDLGLIYATPFVEKSLGEEITVFPGGLKRDLMDACEIADRMKMKPRSTEEYESEEIKKERRRHITSRAGY